MSQIAVIGLAVICFGCFTWAIYFYFKTPGSMPKQMKQLGLTGLIGFCAEMAGLVVAPVGPLSIVGGALILGGLTLFWCSMAAARSARLGVAYAGLEPEGLVCAGPYRWIRHPFYSSYMLFWIGGAVAAANLFLLIVPAVMFLFYWQAAKAEEAQLSASRFGIAYAEYKRRTGMFLPV